MGKNIEFDKTNENEEELHDTNNENINNDEKLMK